MLGTDVMRVDMDDKTFGWFSGGLYFTDLRCLPGVDQREVSADVAA